MAALGAVYAAGLRTARYVLVHQAPRRHHSGAFAVLTNRRPVTILVVDDEQNLVELVRGYLERESFAVLSAGDGVSALALARTAQPDLLILDLMLPGLDGLEVCRRLRQFSDAYVLMLTARAEEVDKIVGLSVGADDYLTKPFSPRELVARVKAMLRRPRSGSTPAADVEPPQRIGELVIDRAQYQVTYQGEVLPLTVREFALLAALAAHPGRVFTRGQLLEWVMGSEHYDEHVVEVHIANLRKKLDDDPSRPRYIQTVRGVGYRFLTRPEAQSGAPP
jgi:two-component system alkaline phosphatase synthesis response regulator PhoP